MKSFAFILLPIIAVSTFIFVIPDGKSDSNSETDSLNTPQTSAVQASELVIEPDTLELFPAILVKENDSSVPIRMSELKIHTEITGNLSYVTYDMTFYNDQDRILEGELYFPLGAGQSVSHFELEVNGKMREGVIVEKEKGRVAFESTVRVKVDPGLVEWTKGSSFKTRIYPIPAKGYKRVIIGFHQELQMTENGSLFQIPMNFKDQVEQFDFTAEVIQQTNIPLIPANQMSLEFTNWQDNFKTSTSKKNYTPNENIGFFIPFVKNESQTLSYHNPITKEYFYYGVIEQVVDISKVNTYSDICIVLDASHSQRNNNLDKELQVLDQFMSKNKITSVTLKILRNDYQYQSKSTWSAVKSEILKTIRDGGTQFGSITESDKAYDAIFLLSDGIQTFGKTTPNFGNNKVFALNSNKEANHGFLRNLCKVSGGQYLNLQSTSVVDATTALNTDIPSIQIKTSATPNYLSTRYQIKDNKIYHTFSFMSTDAIQNINYVLSTGATGQLKTINSTYESLPNICAQRITEDWADIATKSSEITQIGKKYHIVTPNTSLIVLDRVEDYVLHEITPPAELQDEYTTLLAQKSKNEKEEYNNHITTVVTAIDAKMTWYNTLFDWKKIMQQKKEFKNKLNEVNEINNESEESERSESSEGFRTIGSFNANGSVITQEAVYDMAVMDAGSIDGAEVSNTANERTEDTKSTAGKRKEINIETWSPDTPYLKKLKEASGNKYETYISLKKEYQDQPSFYLDVVEFFVEAKQKDIAIRVLSNVAEMELENHQLLRILAHRLEQLNENELAYLTYLEVEKIRAEEPQSYRDLGLICDKLGRHQEAINYLNYVITTQWDGRFPNIEVIVSSEMSKIIHEHPELDLQEIDPKVITQMPMDLRIVVDWDANNCDIDLWVTDPLGEKCFYSNKETKLGGWMSSDFTGGYGPEEFVIKTGAPGEYKVELNYYGSTQQTVAGPTTIMVKLYTNYGKSNQKLKEVTRRVSSEKEVLAIGSIEI
ncbi:MAG: tetratricopeptide (TPR) repeat protein [Flavobacteriales bacterium]|jgi:tetratricopeptide (TPR) repeat protein